MLWYWVDPIKQLWDVWACISCGSIAMNGARFINSQILIKWNYIEIFVNRFYIFCSMKFSQSHQMRYAIIVIWSTYNLFFSVRYGPLFCAVLCVKKRRRKTVLILRFDQTKFSRNEIKREHTKSEVNYRTSCIKKNVGLYFWFVICDFEIFSFKLTVTALRTNSGS